MQAFTPARLDYNIAAAPATLTFWPRPALTSSQLSWRADGGAWEQLNASGMCSAAGTSGVTLAVRTDRTLSGWGSGVTNSSASLPQGLTDVVAVAAGNLHAMALTGDGRIIVWGDTSNGQNVVPVVPGGFAAMASGRRHCLALTAAGIVRAWGQNTNSQSTVPAGLPPISALAGGNSHSLALSRDGRVFSWGSMAQSTVPAGLPPVVAIAAGDSFNAVLKHDGTVTAWGDNAYGQSTISAGLTGVTAIACGGRHVIVLKQDGSVVTWGDNTSGQRTVPAGLNNFAAVNAGGSLSLAVRKTGVVTIWGTNSAGALNIPAGLLVPGLPSHVAVPIHAGSNAINFKLEPPDASASRAYSVTARGSFLPLYTAWAAAVFPAGTPAAQSAPNADPDNDGLLSGIEYLLSTNPRTANPSPLAIRTEGDDFLVTFPRRSGVPDGLETVQVSVNPGAAWTLADTSAITRTDNGPGQPQTVTVRLSRTAGSMFVRLKADF